MGAEGWRARVVKKKGGKGKKGGVGRGAVSKQRVRSVPHKDRLRKEEKKGALTEPKRYCLVSEAQ